MYKNATEARTVVPLVLQELNNWHHNRVLAIDMGVRLSPCRYTNHNSTYEVRLRSPNELGPRADKNYGR